MRTLFTSDTHFSHANIIKYCARPFADVEEMNEEMVSRWNEKVAPDDVVHHLGDFAFGPVANLDKFRKLLNGKIIVTCGNHDRSPSRMLDAGFEVVLPFDAYIINKIDGVSVAMRHVPPANPYGPWKTEDGQAIKADYFLHGHVHEKWRRRGNLINVGVDVRGFRPMTINELLCDA